MILHVCYAFLFIVRPEQDRYKFFIKFTLLPELDEMNAAFPPPKPCSESRAAHLLPRGLFFISKNICTHQASSMPAEERFRLRRDGFSSAIRTPATINAAPSKAAAGSRSPARRPIMPAQTGSPA